MQKLEIKKKINAVPISNAGGNEKLIINSMWPNPEKGNKLASNDL